MLQPTHLFLFRRYTMQMPQFIPQGAIKMDGMFVAKNISVWEEPIVQGNTTFNLH